MRPSINERLLDLVTALVWVLAVLLYIIIVGILWSLL